MGIEVIVKDYNPLFSENPLSHVSIRRGLLNPLNEREISFELTN